MICFNDNNLISYLIHENRSVWYAPIPVQAIPICESSLYKKSHFEIPLYVLLKSFFNAVCVSKVYWRYNFIQGFTFKFPPWYLIHFYLINKMVSLNPNRAFSSANSLLTSHILRLGLLLLVSHSSHTPLGTLSWLDLPLFQFTFLLVQCCFFLVLLCTTSPLPLHKWWWNSRFWTCCSSFNWSVLYLVGFPTLVVLIALCAMARGTIY